MKEPHYLWYVLLVILVVALVLAGWMFFTTTAAFTALATGNVTTGAIEVHAYAGSEVGAVVTVIDQGFHDMGDTNWDGKIDAKDVSLASSCFGKYVSKYPECSAADITGLTPGVPDGKVDARDVALVSKNYGKKAPSYTTPFQTDVKAGQLKLVATYSNQTQTDTRTIYTGTFTKINFDFNPIDVKTYTCPSNTTNYTCSSGTLTCYVCSTEYTTKNYLVNLTAVAYENTTNGTALAGIFYVNDEYSALRAGQKRTLLDATIFGVTTLNTNYTAFYLQSSYETKSSSLTAPFPKSTTVNLIVGSTGGCGALTNSCPNGYTPSCSGSTLTCTKY